MARTDFINQLKELGYAVEELGDGKVAIPYSVQTGRFAGQAIKLGFIVSEDFNLNPPSGPHVSPRLLPIKSGGVHPDGGIHDSPFGPDWQYWSRPINHWGNTQRTVKDVLAHLRRLFDTIL
jgi:hypothetical protein